MKYTGENPRLNYSEDQFVSNEEYHRLFTEYDAYSRELLTTDIRDLNGKMYGIRTPDELTDEQERKRKISRILGIFILIVFIAIIVAFVLKQLAIGGILFSSVFAIVGLSLILSGRTTPDESSSASLKNRIMGVFIFIVSISVIGFILLRDRFTESEIFVWIFIFVFGGAGLGLLTLTIINAFSRKLIYTATAEARCTGYVRKVGYDESEANSTARRIPVMCTSPVFEYSYEGTRCRSVYDVFPAVRDSKVALGETVTINIDPRNPENVLCTYLIKPAPIVFEAVFSFIFVGVAVFLGVMMANGNISGMTVETSWNSMLGTEETMVTDPSSLKITDEDVERSPAYATNAKDKEWFVEDVVVDTVERVITDDFDGYRITFTDDSFVSIRYVKDDPKIPAKGDTLIIFYTIDNDYKELGYGYKRSFSYLLPSEGEYVGNHRIYQRDGSQ